MAADFSGDEEPVMSPLTPESYAKWRSQFPWTDEEFAVACEEEAALVEGENRWMAHRYRYSAKLARAGRISREILNLALPRLIRTCFCGRKALYRTGNEGRCSEHRLVKSRNEIDRVKRIEERSSVLEAAKKRRDDSDLSQNQLKHTGRGRALLSKRRK